MSDWRITFDGSTTPGVVIFSDGVIAPLIARFDDDEEARLFFGLMNEMRDESATARAKLKRLLERMDSARDEVTR